MVIMSRTRAQGGMKNRGPHCHRHNGQAQRPRRQVTETERAGFWCLSLPGSAHLPGCPPWCLNQSQFSTGLCSQLAHGQKSLSNVAFQLLMPSVSCKDICIKRSSLQVLITREHPLRAQCSGSADHHTTVRSHGLCRVGTLHR